MADMATRPMAERKGGRLFASPVAMTVLYWVATALLSLAFAFRSSSGTFLVENDDLMRLVEVRDFLGGQGWFDLMQYRLGLEGGTLMHWSRLVDLPIALLVRFFALFIERGHAEEWAAATWPVLLMPVLLLPLALSARRIGGVTVMHVGLGLGALFLFGSARFSPGFIDHHNIQLALVMWIAAALTDPRSRHYWLAGVACALAVAIGAETVPIVAAACLCVAMQWIWFGEPSCAAARSFGLSLAVSVTALFMATVPPRDYGVVTCDTLSLGFYSLLAMGGLALFVLASQPALGTKILRFLAAACTGGALLAAAFVIAPQCLGNPLASLDPMLMELWLDHVAEAQSAIALALGEPASVGRFYAVGFLALAVCFFRAVMGQQPQFHLKMLLLIGVSWAVALFQLRGNIFADMLAVLPLSLLIVELRRLVAGRQHQIGLSLAYILLILASTPVTWALGGAYATVLSEEPGEREAGESPVAAARSGECGSDASWQVLNDLPPGLVAGPSNSGSEILFWTHHRVLSAPYHRNEKGMLAELRIGLAPVEEAETLLAKTGVTILAFCPTDPQTGSLIGMKPDGLYGLLKRGVVPAYLQPVETDLEDGFRIFRFHPAAD